MVYEYTTTVDFPLVKNKNGWYVTEEAVKKGFVKAYNKLRTYEKEILDKTIADLSELQNKRTRGNAEINQIDSEILRLSEQNSRFENFRSKGILDEIVLIEFLDISPKLMKDHS